MTTDTISDPVLSGLALDLLTCLEDAAKRTALPPKRFNLRPGIQIDLLLSTTVDECCEGLAWVRPVLGWPSATFPVIDQTFVNCYPVQWAVQLEMGIARCAPRPSTNQLVTPEAWTDLTLAILDDYAAMRTALCCFEATHPDLMYLAGTWEPLPVDGGCVGGRQMVTVAVGACDCP